MEGSMISEAMFFKIDFERLFKMMRILLNVAFKSLEISSWICSKKDFAEITLVWVLLGFLVRVGLIPFLCNGGKRRPMAWS